MEKLKGGFLLVVMATLSWLLEPTEAASMLCLYCDWFCKIPGSDPVDSTYEFIVVRCDVLT